MHKSLTGLWRHPDFLKLWAGETVSLLGSQVTFLALPLAAATTLEASPLQMGTLGTVQYLPWLLVGLLAGAWVDRSRRRPVMVAADLGRAFLLGLIPLAVLGGLLGMALLYAVGFLVGILNVFFEVAYAAYLPSLVPRDRLVEGNSKLQLSASVAEIGGPGLAGGLVQLVTAPFAIAVDALSFLVSALCLTWIRSREARAEPTDQPRFLLAEIREGLRLVFLNPILRAFALASVTTNFFVDMHLAVFVLFATRELGISPVGLGSLYGVGAVGGLVGSMSVGRLTQGLGLGRFLVAAQAFVTLAVFAIPLAGRHLWLIVVAEAMWGFAVVVYVINATSLRQATTPHEFQGRVAASLRFVTWGISPLGFLIGGILGETIGLRATLVVAGIGPLLSIVWLVLSPVPGVREVPPPQGPEAVEAEVG